MSTRLAEIVERANKAAPGPWVAEDETSFWDPDGELTQHHWENCPFGCADGECEGHATKRLWAVAGLLRVECADWAFMTEEDAQFIAHAREDIPWLIKQLQAKRDPAVRGQGA